MSQEAQAIEQVQDVEEFQVVDYEAEEGESVARYKSTLNGMEWIAAGMFAISLFFLMYFPRTGALSQIDSTPDGAPNAMWFPMFWTAVGLLLLDFGVFFLQGKRGRVAMLLAIGSTAITMTLLLGWYFEYQQFVQALK